MTSPLSSRTILSFRPFFLGATLFSIGSMVAWMAVFLLRWPIQLSGISMFQWHAHEMIFGYALAVVAGFLLTAARNWTGHNTVSGNGLWVLFAAWLLARLLLLFGTRYLAAAAAADLLFLLGLGIAVSRPIVKARQKRQAAVLLIIGLLTAANSLFYLGALGYAGPGVRIGIHGGLYLVLGMTLFMGRRVIPFFTEKGVGYPVKLVNEHWNDVSTFALYPLFLLSELLVPFQVPGAIFAAALFVLNSLRVGRWHTLGIWQKPLLWGLFTAFMMINLGFLLRALMPVTTIPNYLPMHAFAVGGIGLITISMMARVTLGHTGRDVYRPPRALTVLMACMVLTSILRIFLPLLGFENYRFWMAAAGLMWIISFCLFAIVFIPMLVRPRVDGKPG